METKEEFNARMDQARADSQGQTDKFAVIYVGAWLVLGSLYFYLDLSRGGWIYPFLVCVNGLILYVLVRLAINTARSRRM
jgi:hypothetical protein